MKISKKIFFSFCFIVFIYTTGICQERLKNERWGNFGVGKLVNKMSNTNNIGNGQLRWTSLGKFPAFEFPYNPDPDARHTYYGVGVSFHVGGHSMDRGPDWIIENPDDTVKCILESGDQANYSFYKGFHFDSFPEYIAESYSAPLPVSNDSNSWPVSWPEFYPSSDYVLQMPRDDYPGGYPTCYSEGISQPIPLLLDSLLGFPGAGPNKYTPEGVYYPGQVVADQEAFTVSFAKNKSDDLSNGHLMVYTSLRGLSWRGDLAQDFLYWIFTVTNIGTEPIDSTYMGMYADFDFPYGSYSNYSSYSKVDCYACDTYDINEETGREYKIAYGWDGDGNVPGATYGDWDLLPPKYTDEAPVENVALPGIILLQTPKDTTTGEELGLKSFDAFTINIKSLIHGIGGYAEKFYWLNVVNSGYRGRGNDPDDIDSDGIDDWTWDHPFPMGNEELYNYGYKAGMTVNTGGFQIKPGKTDTLILATVMGENRADLFKNAKIARKIFKSGWIVPKPPFAPRVVKKVESGKITLRWGTISENDSLNTMFGRQPFEGYKIYRSDDGGLTWGERPITDDNGTVVDYVPMAQNDLSNGITGTSSLLPTFNRGNDSGMEDIVAPEDSLQDIFIKELNGNITDTLHYIYTDESVQDGFTYKYAVIAYGAGDESMQPLQNARTSGPNVVTVTPHAEMAINKSDLDMINVVPNPYRVINLQETAIRERMIKFTHLPEKCTIRIFNITGELIATLHHSKNSSISSVEPWNLRSYENRDIAPGLYFYHVESDLGEKTGKLAIIK